MTARISAWCQQLWQATHNLIMPPICAGCHVDMIDLHEGLPLCNNCSLAFTMAHDSICHRCAAPAPAPSIRSSGCVHCEKTAFRFHRVATLGVYEQRLKEFVLRMKHAGQEPLSLAAGRLLARHILEKAWEPFPELVTAIPMHWFRRTMSGFNPAAYLAEAVANELKLPLALDLGNVLRAVPRQASLTPNQRRHNMRGVFSISRAYNIRNAHILVVDDVLTTAATANVFSQALRVAGAASVSIGVIARGIGKE